jgi:hypothetical protein
MDRMGMEHYLNWWLVSLIIAIINIAIVRFSDMEGDSDHPILESVAGFIISFSISAIATTQLI